MELLVEVVQKFRAGPRMEVRRLTFGAAPIREWRLEAGADGGLPTDRTSRCGNLHTRIHGFWRRESAVLSI